jgi:hypothetical protein
MITQTKRCTACGIDKPSNDFYTRNSGQHLRTKCKSCLNRHEYSAYGDNPTYRAKRKRAEAKSHAKQRFERANNINRHKYVYSEAHKQDRKHNRECDLDIEFVKNLISNGCTYCGRSPGQCKMTLDRVDNTLGHAKTNVVPACTNCNLTRGSMPYEPWVKFIAPAMRQANESGSLIGWKANRFS